MESSTIFPTFVSAVFGIWAAVTLYQYAAIGTKKRVLFVSYLGFVVSFGCVVLISFDIDNTLANRYRSFLYYAWRVMYWSLQLLSWVIFPFNMEKERSGSWKKSLHVNAIWWGIYAVCGLGAIVYFYGVTDYGWHGMLAFAYAASNTFGLLLIILLAGYGLVAAPKWMYLKSQPKQYLDHLYIKAVSAEDSRLAAKYDLQDAFNSAKKVIDANDPDMLAVSAFLSTSYGIGGASPQSTSPPSGHATTGTPDPDKQVALREALQTAKRAISAWKMLVRECILYENIYAQEGTNSAVSPFHAMMHRVFTAGLKATAVASGILSALIIIGQSTIFIDVWWLSVLAVIFREGVWNNPSILEGAVASFVIQALLTIPPLWVYYCCFWSLARLKLSKFYGLYPMHNTDTISLMWCGGMFIRISFALVYNYLFVLRMPDHPSTVFEEMQGWMNVVPLLGDTVTVYFPLLILFIAIMTLTNTYSKILTLLGLNSFQFDSPNEPGTVQKLIDEGKKLIMRERQTRRGSIEAISGGVVAQKTGVANSLEAGLTKILGRNSYSPLEEEISKN
jgi:hypothetical protein